MCKIHFHVPYVKERSIQIVWDAHGLSSERNHAISGSNSNCMDPDPVSIIRNKYIAGSKTGSDYSFGYSSES